MDEPTIILFDGHCNLCSRSVQFILRRDRAARFRFAALSSEAAARACVQAGIAVPKAVDPDSIVVIAGGRALERSDAALAIAAQLPFPWRSLGLLRIVPRALRDWLYRIVARNRDRWFGRRDTCMLPTAETRARFLE